MTKQYGIIFGFVDGSSLSFYGNDVKTRDKNFKRIKKDFGKDGWTELTKEREEIVVFKENLKYITRTERNK